MQPWRVRESVGDGSRVNLQMRWTQQPGRGRPVKAPASHQDSLSPAAQMGASIRRAGASPQSVLPSRTPLAIWRSSAGEHRHRANVGAEQRCGNCGSRRVRREDRIDRILLRRWGLRGAARAGFARRCGTVVIVGCAVRRTLSVAAARRRPRGCAAGRHLACSEASIRCASVGSQSGKVGASGHRAAGSARARDRRDLAAAQRQPERKQCGNDGSPKAHRSTDYAM